ncbi:MAG: nucleotidyltransferase substrate binding protein [Deferribacteraceae bacterium]|jgi:nucleotidyltransferase substrate binding protein (TIGR01987 family)|nr:nucleotidyltransferase substrate binding protein [Deferribacteraceae bacterium]
MINTDHLQKYIEVLERSYVLLKASVADSIEYEMYRNSLVKSFEMTLELAGKLPYFASRSAVDALVFKDIFRSAAQHSLLRSIEVERWLKYRDNRNNTAHNYGESFAQDTLSIIDDFIVDAKNLKTLIDK